MRRTYIYDHEQGKVVEKPPETIPQRLQVIGEITPYKSPLGTGLIDSRHKRREDLKRSGCREVDPTEYKPTYINERFARKHGLPFGEQ